MCIAWISNKVLMLWQLIITSELHYTLIKYDFLITIFNDQSILTIRQPYTMCRGMYNNNDDPIF